MKTVNATSFCKQASCPTSEMLLSYHACELESESGKQVATHLAACDFCCAEMQLLAECPQADECEWLATEIPLHLRQLAEELLAGSFLTADMFIGTGYEKERLTLTDA